MIRIAVLISGNGTNLQSLIDGIESEKIDANIAGVISNREDAYGLQRAQEANIRCFALTSEPNEPRGAYDQRLGEIIDELDVELIVLAGFMRILSPEFVQKFPARILNIHPSILPKYPGLNTHQQALNNNDTDHVCTIHFVT